MNKENWQEVGSIFEQLCDQGFFPGLGYDADGWEAWVFFDVPIEGQLGDHVKVIGKTAIGAMKNLMSELAERGEV